MTTPDFAHVKFDAGCPLCAAREHRRFLTLASFSYLRCQRCSLVFLGPEVQFDGGNVYTKDYIQKRGHDMGGSAIVKAKEATARHYLALAEKYAGKGNLLEVGCSTGSMLKVAQERGWKVFGVEINESAAAIASQTLQAQTIETQSLNEAMFPGTLFSLVLLFDVIEHISEPLKFMNILRDKLAPGGMILLITPNMSSWSARILKDQWPHFMPEHACLYGPKSMNVLLEKARLRTVKSGWASKFVNMGILRRHLECHPHTFLSRYLQPVMKRLSPLESIVFSFNVGEMYVLAGEQ